MNASAWAIAFAWIFVVEPEILTTIVTDKSPNLPWIAWLSPDGYSRMSVNIQFKFWSKF